MAETYYIYQLRNCKGDGDTKLVFTDEELFNSKCDECEEPYIYNESLDICEKFTEEQATIAGKQITVEQGITYSDYGWGGAKFYKTLDNYVFPVKEELNGNFTDDNSNSVPVLYTRDYFWKNTTGSNGRLNDVGVWGNIPNNEWIGFSTCVISNEKKKINIGIASNNCARIKLNGELVVEMDLS